MIVFERRDELGLITQSDHAHLAADLLSLVPGLASHPRRSLLLRATRLHDNGWREIDAAPPLDDKGRPHDFLSLPEPQRIEVWDRATARYTASDPACALLIVEHALYLFRAPASPSTEDLVQLLRRRREDLLERCPELEPQLALDSAYVRAADLLSLVLCNGWERPFEVDFGEQRVSGLLEEATLTLDPLPYRGITTFRVACRYVPARRYGGLPALGQALGAAEWQSLSFRVSGPPS